MHYRPTAPGAMLLLLVVLLLSGCGTPRVKFTAANKASIRSAAVPPQSDYPDREQIMVYTFAKNASAAWGGLIGAIISQVAAGDDRGAMLALLKQNNIDPGKIVAEAFEREFRAYPVVPLANGSADARFVFDVTGLEFRIRHAYATALSPGLQVEGKLIRRDGTVLWREEGDSFESDYRQDAKDYAKNPRLLREGIEQAARSVARQFLTTIHEQSGGVGPEEAAERAQDARDAAQEAQEDAEYDRQKAARDAQRAEAKRQREAAKAEAKRKQAEARALR